MNNECHHALENLSAYEDGQLTSDESAAIAAHLKGCESCRNEATSQSLVRTQLRRYRETMEPATLPTTVWNSVQAEWNMVDRRRSNRRKWAFATALGALPVIAMGAAYLRHKSNTTFPTELVFADFENHPAAEFKTRDADRAAMWLRSKLNAELSPFDLRIARNQLVGASCFHLPSGDIGRLHFRSGRGDFIIYLAPGRTSFADKPKDTASTNAYSVRTGLHSVLQGWNVEGSDFAALADIDQVNVPPLATTPLWIR